MKKFAVSQELLKDFCDVHCNVLWDLRNTICQQIKNVSYCSLFANLPFNCNLTSFMYFCIAVYNPRDALDVIMRESSDIETSDDDEDPTLVVEPDDVVDESDEDEEEEEAVDPPKRRRAANRGSRVGIFINGMVDIK